mgnify:FL=1
MTEHEKDINIKSIINTDNALLSFNYIEKSVVEDFIKCDLCNTIFDLNIHAPLMVKCGHTFCKKCISLKSNNEKNINKSCPFDKMKNVMNLDSSIPNLKLESIVKKLTTYIQLNNPSNKKQMVYSKPVNKSRSPIKSHNSNKAINNIQNNIIKNNLEINNNNNNNNNNNININNTINIKKEFNTSNSIKNKNNANKKKQQNNKTNNINLVNTIKNKINALNNIKNINNNVNINNINDVDKINVIYNNLNPQNCLTKTMSSEINDNLTSPQIDEEIILPKDKFHFKDEKFNKGMINETIDTIPMYEEKSLGDTSLYDDINELLLKSMMTKKKSITEETITEEFNNSSSKNLKKLNLMGNQDSLKNGGNKLNGLMLQSQKLPQPFIKLPFNFSLTPNKNNLNLHNCYQQFIEFKPDLNTQNEENNNEIAGNNNFHQIRTIYDIINLKLKNSGNNKENSKESNNSNNIINNISNNIIIINNEDNINIITDTSRSQSQENILRNTRFFNGDQFTLINNETNNEDKDKEDMKNAINNNKENNKNINIINNNNIQSIQSERNIKTSTILSKNINKVNNQQIKKESKDNLNNFNDKVSTSSKISKIGIHKHKHSNSDDCNEEKNKKYLDKDEEVDKKYIKKNNPSNNIDKVIKEKISKGRQKDDHITNNSFDSCSNSLRNLLTANNNLSKSFVNSSGNNLEDLEGNKNGKKNTNIKNDKINKENNKFKTLNNVKSSKSQIEKINNNIYYDNRNNKENNAIHPILIKKKYSGNNNNNNHNEIRNNNKDNDIEKDNFGTTITSQCITNRNVSNDKSNLNDITKTKSLITDQSIKKNIEAKEEIYKRLKSDFDSLMNEKMNLTSFRSSFTNSSINSNTTINIKDKFIKIRKRQDEAFQNFFKSQKYRSEWSRAKIKFSQNGDFFIGVFEQDEKYPKRGILVSSGGDYYDGEFVNGKKEGEGKLIYMNGNKYEGSFARGRQNGKGKLTQIDGDTYEGEWKDGKTNGQGTRYHNNGDKYVGNHLNNLRNGKGYYLFANGDSYEGNWVNGIASGRGILRFKNGDIYDGEFKNNNMFGKGTFTKKNGDVLIGEFINGLINGKGRFENALGEKYIGEFLSGKKHGVGKLYNKEGKLIQAGNWKNDKFCPIKSSN